MMRRTPMKRSPMTSGGTKWTRREQEQIAATNAPPLVFNTIKPLRPGTYAGSTTGIAVPKEPRLENPHLLLMARAVLRPCLLAVKCSGFTQQCVACHGNGAEWNKARGMKAHDFFSVWGCPICHRWLDESYSATHEERDAAFRRALDKQILEWGQMAASVATRAPDRAAARWALDHLIERGYARLVTSLDASRYHYAMPNVR